MLKTALICGTSTGHMSISDSLLWIRGAWGPFYGALFPRHFVHSAGQSVAGLLVDFVIRTHPAHSEMRLQAQDKHSHEYLNEVLRSMVRRRDLPDYDGLTRDVHVWPDYHGNRSPLDEPSLRGMLVGLSMASDVENLAVVYLAFIQALAVSSIRIFITAQHCCNQICVWAVRNATHFGVHDECWPDADQVVDRLRRSQQERAVCANVRRRLRHAGVGARRE